MSNENINNPVDPSNFYKGNPKLRNRGTIYKYTNKEVVEMVKCMNDPLYFINNYVKVVSVDNGIIPFHTYPYQNRIVDKLDNNRFVICKLPRQSGKSTIVAAYFLWYATFHDHKDCVILANKMSTAKEIFSRVCYMYEELPGFLKQGLITFNKMNLEFENGSKIEACPSSNSSIRGRSVSLLCCDEFAFLPPSIADDMITSIMPTLSSGKNSKLIIISTPCGMNQFYKIWKDSESGHNDFVRVEGSWKEIHDQQWYETQSKLLGSAEMVAQELDCSFVGSSTTLIDSNKIYSLPQAKPIEVRGNLRYFNYPENGHQYVITVDTSRGRDSDFSALIVFDVTKQPFTVVATFKDNKINPTVDYPALIDRVGRMYFNAPILIESNDLGESVASKLWYDYEYDNVLWTDKQEVSSSTSHGILGMRTTRKSKQRGTASIKDLIEHDQVVVSDFRIIQELSVYVKQTVGLWGAQDTNINDDLCTCLFLFGWLFKTQYFKQNTNTENVNLKLRNKIQDKVDEYYIPFPCCSNGTELTNPYGSDLNAAYAEAESQWLEDNNDYVSDGIFTTTRDAANVVNPLPYIHFGNNRKWRW